MTIRDPYAVLGLSRGADKAAVKKAYRQKALKTHPDINPSPAAAEEYNRVYQAAQAILNGTEYSPRGLHQTASSDGGWRVTVDRVTRYAIPPQKSGFPLAFSAACLVGGCIIFAGAVHAHKAIFDGYSYHVLEEAERRKELPSPEQLRINSLLMEKREQDNAAKRR